MIKAPTVEENMDFEEANMMTNNKKSIEPANSNAEKGRSNKYIIGSKIEI